MAHRQELSALALGGLLAELGLPMVETTLSRESDNQHRTDTRSCRFPGKPGRWGGMIRGSIYALSGFADKVTPDPSGGKNGVYRMFTRVYHKALSVSIRREM